MNTELIGTQWLDKPENKDYKNSSVLWLKACDDFLDLYNAKKITIEQLRDILRFIHLKIYKRPLGS